MKKIIEINEFESLRQKWADENMIGELSFRHRLLFDLDNMERGKPLIGSELDEDGNLGRAIENYQMLGKCLESKKDFDPIKYFPRIPKVLKDIMPERFWPLTDLAKPLMSVPFFLHGWSLSKKTCLINKSKLIPIINPEDGNFLNHLPYNCFLLKLADGIKFHITGFNIIKGYDFSSSNIVILRVNDHLLQALIIPEGFMGMIIDSNDRRKYQEYIRSLHGVAKNSKQAVVIGRKIVDFLNDQIYKETKVENKPLLVVSMDPTLGAILYEKAPGVIGKIDSEDLTNADVERMPQAKLLCLLNGLGKLFKDLSPAEPGNTTHGSETSGVAKSKTDSSNKISDENMSWTQLHQGQVTKVGLERTETSVQIKSIIGDETIIGKSPHLRRTHERNYRDKNGKIVKTVLIKQVTVRTDKLNKASLRGSSLEFEE